MFDDQESWEEADAVRSETKGGQFIRLKSGEKVQVVFPVKPFAYRQVWLGDHSEIYDPEKHDGKRPSGRFAFAVFEPVEGKAEYTPKILDVSGETYDAIKKCRDKYGPRHLFEIERQGSGLNDTKYTVLPERPLKDKELEYLRSLEPLDAKEITLSGGSPDDDAEPTPVGEDPWPD